MDNSLSALSTLARNWWAFVLRGLIAIGFGLIAWFWPDLALNTLIWLFAIFAFFTGILAIVAAIRAISQRERWLGLAAEGVIGVGAGIVAVVWPDLTAKTFLFILAAWAIVTGLLSISSAVRLRKEISGEWALGLSGLALILFGIIAFARPKSGALAVLWLIGLSAIVFGILWVILGLELRRMRGPIAQLANSAAQSPSQGPAPQPVPAARQAGSSTNQGVASSPPSVSTPSTAAAPAAAAAALSSTPGKSDVVTESAGTVSSVDDRPMTSSTAGATSGMAPSSTATEAEDGMISPEALAAEEAAAVVGQSTSARDAKADEQEGVDARAAAETIGVPSDSSTDSAPDAADSDDRTRSHEAAAVELSTRDESSPIGASESGDDVTTGADAPPTADATTGASDSPTADAMSGTGAPPATEATTGADAPSVAETGTGSSSARSDASMRLAGVNDQAASENAADGEETANLVGSSSGGHDSSDDALDDVGESSTAEASSGASGMAADMPRSTRRERALADLVAGLPPEGTGWVLGNGTLTNPEGYPLKGNASSRIYHTPGGQSYDVTIAEICFATSDVARSAGFRPRQGDPGAEGSENLSVDSATLQPTDESGVVDVAASSETDDLAVTESLESTSDDIPSEFRSHLVGETSTESADDAGGGDSDRNVSADTGSTEMEADVAPMGIDVVESEQADGSQQAGESNRSLSRSEQELQELIATLPPEGAGWVRGTNVYTTPAGYPVKGNASSRIYHLPGGQNYQATIPEICFATVDDARTNGFRPRHGDPAEADWSHVEETPESVAMGIGHADVSGAAGASRAEQQIQEIIAGLPPEGTDWTRGTGVYTTPYGYAIKGNASSRIYHVPGGQNYQATIPEICFASVDAARAGGFRPRHGDPAEPDYSLVEVTPGTEPLGIAADPNAADIDPDVAAILADLPSNDPGWHLGDGTPDCPATHPIKGNASSRIFHVEEGRSYKATIPEFCFATEEDAIAAGFRRARA